MIKHLKGLTHQNVAYSNKCLRSDDQARATSFAQSQTSRAVHTTNKKHFINKTLRNELKLLSKALDSEWVTFDRPISHCIARAPSGRAGGDSSLLAAGGYSIDMGFWWHIEWLEEIRRITLRYIRNNKDGNLISINVLEYATVIINYVASTFYFTKISPNPTDPYPAVLIEADNTTSESWVIKACKVSLIGRALGRLQCALMITNPVGINAGHVSTNDNFIADGISRITTASNADSYFTSLQQVYPQLRSC